MYGELASRSNDLGRVCRVWMGGSRMHHEIKAEVYLLWKS